MIARCPSLLVSLLAVAVLPYCFRLASAEDEVEDLGAAGGEGGSENPMLELKEKLAQLQGLMAAKGDQELENPAFEELREKLLGLGQKMGVPADLPSVSSKPSQSPQEADKMLQQMVAACMTMASKHFGPMKSSVIGAWKKLARDGFTQQQAVDNEMIKLGAVCLNDMTEAEFKEYMVKKSDANLPRAMISKAKGKEGPAAVLALEDDVWAAIRKLAKALVRQFGDQFEQKKDESSSSRSSSSGSSSSTASSPIPFFNADASTLGILAMAFIVSVAGLLTKSFLDQQKELEANKESKKAKKQK